MLCPPHPAVPLILRRLPVMLAVWSAFAIPSWKLAGQERLHHPVHWRQPVAVAIDHEGSWLAVGNERSHSISIVDVERRQLRSEFQVGQGLSDLCRLGTTNQLIVTDFDQHCIRLLNWKAEDLKQTHQVEVSPYPVGVASAPQGSTFAVASLWSRRLTLFDAPNESQGPREKWSIDLAFAPQEVLFIEAGKQLVVTDAFGGTMAIVDAESGKILRQRSIPAHKMQGLAVTLDGQRLVVSHQMLNSLAHTIRNDVHWGLLMSNDLRWLDLSVLRSQSDDFYKDSHMHPIGQANSGMGDPAGAAMSSNGTVAVALAGVGQIVVGKEEDFSLHAIPVGQAPTDLTFTPNNEMLIVANRFDDSLSWIDVSAKEVVETTSLGETPALDKRQIGERLFHDATLSHDGWMSCSSCHVRGHTNGQLNDNLSDDSFGAPKRVLTLLGKADTEPFAWNGSKESMREQIESSIELTMQGPRKLSDQEVEALTTYLHGLPPAPSLNLARAVEDPILLARGKAIFEQQDCVRCHQPPLYTSPDLYDVGFEDEEGNREFNPPSLRGVSQRGPYFHDNRAGSLEEVLEKFRHQVTKELTSQERRDLIHFLRSL